ncbi:hypothetical protein SYNPS1DRAFT_25503 [Syncephalis pseudoplumigaleata]|uniref:Uncharacterized protein n=1 Tax=Syncephalis pseudoplumigaleata TaxID=1712513 RepID=A0A4V1J0T4_9FUNG|nr:hypothetical protein SYNPS1DRAFT_25503 [Syncephalis pseudoplumigaleata]|eukprot:RKP22669.1 hypothetical protein SYNPS1DRAFT_25503 [Syncephalis pseudoplumigaleata]
MDEKHKRPFQPTFGKVNFMQDWRRKRAKADQEPTPTLDAGGHKASGGGARKRSTDPAAADGRKLVSTLRFEQAKKHVLLNIYLTPAHIYEGLLRWGSVKDTAIHGQTLNFVIGDKLTTRLYLFGIQRFMLVDHKLVYEHNIELGSHAGNLANGMAHPIATSSAAAAAASNANVGSNNNNGGSTAMNAAAGNPAKALAMGTPQQRAAVAAAIARQHQQMIMQNMPAAMNADANQPANVAATSNTPEPAHAQNATANNDERVYD